jgi:hypothetical protein
MKEELPIVNTSSTHQLPPIFSLGSLSPLLLLPQTMDGMDASSFTAATGAGGLSSDCGAGFGWPLLSSGSDGCGAGRRRAELAAARTEVAGRGRPLLRRSPLQRGAVVPSLRRQGARPLM